MAFDGRQYPAHLVSLFQVFIKGVGTLAVEFLYGFAFALGHIGDTFYYRQAVRFSGRRLWPARTPIARLGQPARGGVAARRGLSRAGLCVAAGVDPSSSLYRKSRGSTHVVVGET
jgi:hypothetical protein